MMSSDLPSTSRDLGDLHALVTLWTIINNTYAVVFSSVREHTNIIANRGRSLVCSFSITTCPSLYVPRGIRMLKCCPAFLSGSHNGRC